ncbi:MAG: GGDEF domain-containing protein [Actinomycetota bacterium]|nr:GGDEF domain-containing protein [Actinomycetota bacterium]
MGEDQLRLYRTLSRAPFPKSYVGKVFLTAFLGTHVPLLALLVYFMRHSRFGLGGVLRIFTVTVPATLGGTTLTFWAMYSLSAPTALASRALRRYLDSGELPELPVGYTDRAGRLMADVQYTVERLDGAMHSLGELANRDHLTGIYNRRAADERLAEDVKRAERGGGTLSLTLVDLDHLKPVNDAHGHRAGDACVVHFAEVLCRNVRAGDWVARWGGDEFVVGMWNTQEGQPTKRVLERIVEDLREHPVVLPDGEEARLTFSGGACRWTPGENVRGLLSRADEALYRAKAEGGNTVVHLD